MEAYHAKLAKTTTKRKPFRGRWFPGRDKPAPKPRFRLSGLIFDLLLENVDGATALIRIKEASTGPAETEIAIEIFYMNGGRR